MTKANIPSSMNGKFDIAGTSIYMRGTPSGEAFAKHEGNKVLIAFMEHDPSAQNPLEDCEGEGRIYTAHRYGQSRRKMQEVLGLNPEGGRNYEADSVQAIYASKCMELLMADTEFVEGAKRFYQLASNDAVRQKIWDSYYNPETYHSTYLTYDFPNAPINEDELLDEAWVQARSEGRVGNPFAVILDIYEHGLTRYSVSGEGYQCNFDTASSGAVWVPDAYFELELWGQALASQGFTVTEEPAKSGWVPDEKGIDQGDGIKKSYQIISPALFTITRGGEVIVLARTLEGAWTKAIAKLGAAFNIRAAIEATYSAAVARARDACELYTNYVNGECYDVLTEEWEVVTVDGEVYSRYVDTTSHGSVVGTEAAEKMLQEELEGFIAEAG